MVFHFLASMWSICLLEKVLGLHVAEEHTIKIERRIKGYIKKS